MAKGNDYFDEEITMSKVVDMIFMQTNADNKGEYWIVLVLLCKEKVYITAAYNKSTLNFHCIL